MYYKINYAALSFKFTLALFNFMRLLSLLFESYRWFFISESRPEGWLAVPNKQNIRRYGWKKQYVVVSSKKILFYASEAHKQNNDPLLVLDIE